MYNKLNITILLTAILTAISLTSCGVDDSSPNQFDVSFNAQSGTAYNGKWDFNGKTIDKVQMSAQSTTFVFGTIPAIQIAETIFAGHSIDGVSMGIQNVMYEAVHQSDGTNVYSIKPSVWQFEALVDGKRHNIQLMLGKTSASTDSQSWGKYAPKSRVLTVFLHFTAYTIDNDDPQPLQMKLTYTGTPITDC